jgi:hypothetical protein
MAETLARSRGAPAAPTVFALRALDWRFLLPTPAGGSFRHLVLLGAPPGLAEHAVHAGIARRVSCEPPRDSVADAVACFHEALDELPAAARSLEPGGVLYAEVGRGARGALRPAGLRRALRDAGLTETGVYWCHPDFRRRDAYVPLDSPAALRWYFATLRPAASPRGALKGIALRVAARVAASRRPSLVPCCAVTAIAGPPHTAAASLLGLAFDVPGLQRPGVRPLVLTPRNRRVVLLPFTADGAQPLAALKVSRSPLRNDITENEQRVLAELHARLRGETGDSVPRPLGRVVWGDLVAAAESVVPGRPLSTDTRDWRASARRHLGDFRRVVAWLVDFHRQTELSREPWGRSSPARTLGDTLAAYDQCFGTTPPVQALFAEVRRRSAVLADVSLPTVWAHADLTPNNICRSADRIAVLDWAGGRPGEPLVDLLNFAASWSRDLRRDYDGLRPFSALFLGPDDPISGTLREGILHYMDALEIDRRFAPVLAVRLWCDLATYTSTRDPDPERADLEETPANVFAQYVREVAGQRDRFFARWSEARPDDSAAHVRLRARWASA